MTCPCDRRTFPPPRVIPAGLSTIPRQVATFSQFRTSMLAAIPTKPALASWLARDQDDLGVMLLEMWAYVADILAFYDEVIAHECYLRTARLRPSLRKLIDLLGYVPRPGVGATVALALLAQGRQPVRVPDGTAFRSGAFDGHPPQVFETTAEQLAHPLTNRWSIAPPRPATLGTGSGLVSVASLLVEPPSLQARLGSPIMVQAGSTVRAGTVSGITGVTGADGGRYAQVGFSPSLSLPAATPLGEVRLSVPTQTAGLWTLAAMGSNPPAIEAVPNLARSRLTLDGIYRLIRAGDAILLAKGGEVRWFRVQEASEQHLQINTGGQFTVDGKTVTTSPATIPVTRLLLDASVNDATRKAGPSSPTWAASDAASILVHYRLIDAGTVTAAARTTLDETDPLALLPPVEEPSDGTSPTRLILQDLDGRAVDVGGTVDFSLRKILLDQGTAWDPELWLPVTAYGNIVAASRGERVASETLGSGLASVPGQSFTLKQKPLTYLSAPAGRSQVRSTLAVRVDGVLWSERPSFYGAGPGDQVYIVRQDDAGESTVTFGDGIRGSRLPTGRDNVVATYRYGSGAASPPAGSIVQLAKPVPGVTAVLNPEAAAGGADPEAPDRMRTTAPRSALILGRAVSVQDMEAVAAGSPGVRAVRGEWRWHGVRLRPVVTIWYVGDPGVADDVASAVRAVSDPSTPIEVEAAQSVPTDITLDVEVDGRYLAADVAAAVRGALLDPDSGRLAPERIGIGAPLYRSRLFEAVLSVEGTVAVRGATINGQPFGQFAADPGAGRYFDVEAGSLTVDGEAGAGG